MRLAILAGLVPLAIAAPRDTLAPLHIPREATGDKYIVQMKGGAPTIEGINVVKPDADLDLPHVGAFSATLDADDIEALRLHPDVAFIEKEHKVSIAAPAYKHTREAPYPITSSTTTQSDAPWNLARLTSNTTGSTTYTYPSIAGAGVCTYVIDTGVDTSHPEFQPSRALLVANTVPNDTSNSTSNDGNGHGTHVAGVIAGTIYGVAKKSTILAVKVFDATGFTDTSVFIAGIDFVLGDYQSRATQCPKGIVVNMSLGGAASEAIDTAVQKLLDAGLPVAVAAGNGDAITRVPQNANTVSPARVAGVCTVGATDSNDREYKSSNFGSVVDLQAPGVDILGPFPGNDVGSLTGTSMATPHVSGLMALYLSVGATTGPQACAYVVETALPGRVMGLAADTKNLLAHLAAVPTYGRGCNGKKKRTYNFPKAINV